MWNVLLLEEVDEWFLGLDADEQDTVVAAIDLLEDRGPSLSRPIADRLKGSSLHNLKELRPSGTSIRILFIFDPDRDAVLLVAGDKAGDWTGWYRSNIPIAEQRYADWLAEKRDQSSSP